MRKIVLLRIGRLLGGNNGRLYFCNPYLLEDEYILWKGRPDRGNIITRSDVAVILFGVVWLSFSLFWEMAALQNVAAPFMVIWGLPFVAVGFYMVFGRVIQKIYLRDKTFYVVTNKKILIKKGNRIEMHDGTDLPPMDVEIHKNGNGTILFSATTYGRRGRSYRTFFALENLADVAQAQNAISKMNQGTQREWF